MTGSTRGLFALSLSVAMGMAYGAGYLARSVGTPPSSASVLTRAFSDRAVASAPSSLGYAMRLVTATREDRRRGSAIEASRAIAQAFAKVALSSREKRLSDALGSDEEGVWLRNALLADAHESEIPGAGAWARAYLESLRRDPDRGFAVLERGLSRLPDEFPFEKGALLWAIGTLPGSSARATELATQEMTAPADPGERERAALPATAHGVFLANAPDERAALAGTLDAIALQPGTYARQLIAAQFARKYPDFTGSLSEGLKERGLSLTREAAQ